MSSPFLDALAPWLREAEHWIPLYILLVLFLVLKWKWKGLIAVLALLLNFALTDILSSRVVKPMVERPRPCHVENEDIGTIERVHCGSGYSFTSSHATNHFGFAILWALLLPVYRRWNWIVGIVWAGAISLSQVYVGVHFPLDILAGAVLGFLCARLVYLAYKRILPVDLQLNKEQRA